MDWIGETLKYIGWRDAHCAESTVMSALQNDGLSAFEATVLIENLENYGYVRWKGGYCEITPKGRERMERGES